MIKQLVMGAILACCGTAYGQQIEDLGDLERVRCADFDYDSFGCESQRECAYDYRQDRCDDRRGGGGGGGGNRACSAYDFDPQTCNRQPGCEYDYAYRACVDQFNRPDPRPRSCWELSRNPRLCEQTRGCYFDRRRNECVDDFGPGPGPGPGPRQEWECAAVDNGWEEHGPHLARGRDYNQAQRAALSTCERYHDTCVVRSCNQVF